MIEDGACDHSVAIDAKVQWWCGKTRTIRVVRVEIKEEIGQRSTKGRQLLTSTSGWLGGTPEEGEGGSFPVRKTCMARRQKKVGRYCL